MNNNLEKENRKYIRMVAITSIVLSISIVVFLMVVGFILALFLIKNFQ